MENCKAWMTKPNS